MGRYYDSNWPKFGRKIRTIYYKYHKKNRMMVQGAGDRDSQREWNIYALHNAHL